MVDLIVGNDLKLRTENPTSNSLQRYQSCNVLYDHPKEMIWILDFVRGSD